MKEEAVQELVEQWIRRHRVTDKAIPTYEELAALLEQLRRASELLGFERLSAWVRIEQSHLTRVAPWQDQAGDGRDRLERSLEDAITRRVEATVPERLDLDDEICREWVEGVFREARLPLRELPWRR